MRSEICAALAAVATTAVLMGSASMALAADVDGVEPDPAPTTTSPTTSSPTPPDPSETTPTPTTPTPTTPTPTTDVPETTRKVTDAQLRWGINDESNNRAFAPGTFNFFSAGKIPNLGGGGATLGESQWSQVSGNVSIEKYLVKPKAYVAATWAGLKQTSDGTALKGTNGPFSNHEVVISGGTGTVDPAERSAKIQWKGSFTVLYYSGYSFFYVTDPQLTVTRGVGRLTATLSGYGTSMENQDVWVEIPPVPNVTLANLPAVDLSKDRGFTAAPAYLGVKVDTGAGTPQSGRSTANSSSWGSFPQSFVNFQTTSGTGSYWYSSGGAADPHKVAKSVTVSYAAGAPVDIKAPSTTGGTVDHVTNALTAPPVGGLLTNPGPPLPASALATLPAGPLQTGTTLSQFRPTSTVTGSRPASDESATTGIWMLGGLLLTAAALAAISPFVSAIGRRSI